VVLGVKGIIVFETKVEELGKCDACSYPSYAALHFALIQKSDLIKAENLGFEEEESPRWLKVQ
jgi:hypothetical protein